MSVLGRQVLSLPAQVAEELSKEIIQGVYAPGERLKEVELADRYGVSRTAIREAATILEKEGLVERIPRIGVRVRLITPDEIEEMFFIRAYLLGLAVRRVAEHAADDFLQEIDARVKKVKKLGDDPATTPKRYAEQVLDLHKRIMDATGWRQLSTLFEGISNQVSWRVSVRGTSASFLTSKRRQESADSWIKLNAALQKRDAIAVENEAKAMLLASYEASVDRLRKATNESPRK